MKTISAHKIQILKENFTLIEGEVTFNEYVKLESESDPLFFSWLFGEEFEQDFDVSLSEEHRVAWEALLEGLE